MGFLFKSKQQKEAEFLAPQYLKHIQETTDILNSTTNPDTFFSRYDFLIERVNNLIAIQKYLKFKGEKPTDTLDRLKNSKVEDINDFIKKYYHDILKQIDKLKTEKSKQKRIDNFKSSLSIYFDDMNAENIQMVENLSDELKSRIKLNINNTTNLPVKKDTSIKIDNKNKLINLENHKWYIMISFGKSSSTSYEKAIFLAKNSSRYDEQVDPKGNITHTATYTHSKQDFLDFILLYDLVSSWKSTFFIINGEIIDKKTVGKIKYCYGDKCRAVKSDYCYGASYMTSNPFGCHRLQISAANNPWYSYYLSEGNHYRLNRDELINRINLTVDTFKHCPDFNLDNIMNIALSFPLIISKKDYEKIRTESLQIY